MPKKILKAPSKKCSGGKGNQVCQGDNLVRTKKQTSNTATLKEIEEEINKLFKKK